jgi:predicted small secreted protein
MKILKKSLICLFLAIMGLTAFSGCRTAHGFGEDIENAGEAIQKGTNK